MKLTLDELKAFRADLAAGLEQARARLNMQQGAIEAVDMLIAKEEKAERVTTDEKPADDTLQFPTTLPPAGEAKP